MQVAPFAEIFHQEVGNYSMEKQLQYFRGVFRNMVLKDP